MQVDLADSVRRFWDADAATYDRSPDHGAATPTERAAWREAAPAGRLVLFEGLWGKVDPIERLRQQAREGWRRLRGEPDHHHGHYDAALVAELPLAAGAHPDRIIGLVERTGWGPARLERLRDVEWAQLLALPPANRLLGVVPRLAISAGA